MFAAGGIALERTAVGVDGYALVCRRAGESCDGVVVAVCLVDPHAGSQARRARVERDFGAARAALGAESLDLRALLRRRACQVLEIAVRTCAVDSDGGRRGGRERVER